MDRLAVLQTYVAVAETGSFTTAAERLGLSRAMASRHVQTLDMSAGMRCPRKRRTRVEQEVGVALLAFF